MADRDADLLRSVSGVMVPDRWCAQLAFALRHPGEVTGDLARLLAVLDRAAAEHARRAVSGASSAGVSVAALPAETASSSDGDGREWLSTGAAAAALGLTDRRVRQLARCGALAGRRSGRRWEVDPESVELRRQRGGG